uniref:C2H2-type domain-containing protein n=1 Tax=Timema monikensis TaxID=170555 RepID=A0A7R9DZZ4_9NEOP|nr:unnamed protein product [Timema monikensis]
MATQSNALLSCWTRLLNTENNGAVITENIEAEQQLHLEQCQHVLKQQQQQQQQQFVELSRQEEVSLSQQVQTLPNDVDVQSLGSVQVESESQEEERAPSHNVSEVSTNVKCEPDVLIKVEEMANLIARDSDIDTDIESDSASEDSEGNDAEDHRASTPLGVEREEGGDYLAEASTSQDLQRLANCEGAVNSYEGGDSFMTPATNGLLLLSCPQKTEGLEQATWFFCNMCGKSFGQQEDFHLHYESHCNKCNSCGALFTNKDALKAHRKEMHPRKNVKLEKEITPVAVGVNAGRKAVLSSSAAARRKKWEPKVCSECGKQYRTNYKLSEHMRKHTGERPFACSSCPKSFRSKIGLAQHEAKHTGQYEFSCSTCGKGFQCKSYLIVHQRVHSNLKPYPCPTCSRHFKTKQSLLDHQNRHLGVKPYLCDTCGRRFITKGLCKSHQRVCGKGFLTRVDLRIHSTMHTGEKSFVCEWCGKAFARRDALRCHRRSHTGERPYRCDICGQSFTQFSPLTIHKRLHTGERPYPCEICGKAFVSRSTMSAHSKKHHT